MRIASTLAAVFLLAAAEHPTSSEQQITFNKISFEIPLQINKKAKSATIAKHSRINLIFNLGSSTSTVSGKELTTQFTSECAVGAELIYKSGDKIKLAKSIYQFQVGLIPDTVRKGGGTSQMRTNFIDVSKPAAADLHEFFLEDLAGDYTLQIDKTTGDAQFVSAKGLAFGIAVDSKSLADLRPIIYELKLPSLDFAGKVCGNIDFKKKIVIR